MYSHQLIIFQLFVPYLFHKITNSRVSMIGKIGNHNKTNNKFKFTTKTFNFFLFFYFLRRCYLIHISNLTFQQVFTLPICTPTDIEEIKPYPLRKDTFYVYILATLSEFFRDNLRNASTKETTIIFPLQCERLI